MLSAVETDLNALFTDCKCIRLHSVYQLLSGIKKYEDKCVNVGPEQRSTGFWPISCNFFGTMVNFFLTEVLFVKSLFQSVQVFLFDQNVFVASSDFLSRKIEWNEKIGWKMKSSPRFEPKMSPFWFKSFYEDWKFYSGHFEWLPQQCCFISVEAVFLRD